jgi:hypothetical protein
VLDIHRYERGDASALHLKHVIGRLQWVRLATEVEGQIGQLGNRATVDHILSIPAFLGANLRIKHLGDVAGKGDEGGAYDEKIKKYTGL